MDCVGTPTCSAAPVFVPGDGRRLSYVGYLRSGGSDFKIKLQRSLEATQSCKHCRIHVDWRLRCIFRGCETVLCQALEQCSSLSSFLLEFKSLTEKLVMSCKSLENPMDIAAHEEIAATMSNLGWDKVHYISNNFDLVQLISSDLRGRQHVLTINIPSQYPCSPLTYTADLPIPLRPNGSSSKISALPLVYDQFQEKVSHYQDLWDMLDEIDEKTWVLEPEWPTRSSVMRRIAFGKSASVQIDLDPLHPRAIPEYRLLGPDHVINPIKESISCNFVLWNLERSVLRNLQDLFGTEFVKPPSKDGKDIEGFGSECGVCYSYRLDGKIPDKACDNPQCLHLYHSTCLYEWFRTLRSCHQSFSTLFGECLYCSQQITIQMPS